MGNFFEKMLTGYKKTSQGLPMAPKVEVNDNRIFIGEVEEEGWSRWKPIIKDYEEEFEEIEKLLNADVNKDIKEYFNSYWFIQLEGTFKKWDINLQPVIPGVELKEFVKKLKEYIEEHNGNTNYIPIGSEDDTGFIILLENRTGRIMKENYETGSIRTIAENMCELIDNLKPTIIDYEF